MRNLKAVTMGMATAIALFLPNRPNPAITVTENSQLVGQLLVFCNAYCICTADNGYNSAVFIL
jgi:hypothetical protein